MSETWTKQATHVDPGVDAWRIDAGAIQVAIVFSEADADAILRDHKDAARLREKAEMLDAFMRGGASLERLRSHQLEAERDALRAFVQKVAIEASPHPGVGGYYWGKLARETLDALATPAASQEEGS